MSKLATVILVSGIAAVPIFGRTPSTATTISNESTADQSAENLSSQTVFLVKASGGTSCQIVRLYDEMNLTSIKADPACADVAEGLALATQIMRGPQGNDTLTDAAGKTILVLSPSDGFAYEAIDKNGVQISFEVNGI